MKTILIPVDFSATCENVLKYAAALSKRIQANRIILLKSYYVSLYAQLLPSADFVQLSAENIDEERLGHEHRLGALSKDILQECHPDIKIEIAISEEPLLRAIREVIDTEKPDLLLLGTDAGDAEGESYISQQVVVIAKTSPVPVLIIPAGVQHQPLKNVLIPVDFSATTRLNVVHYLEKLQFASNPQLWVLNVDPQQNYLNHEEENAAALKIALESYNYKVYYSNDKDTVRGILNFAAANDVQLIVALPGKHSFFYNLTHSSITEALAINTYKPVLILK